MGKELVKSAEGIKYLYKYRSLGVNGNLNENTLRMLYDGEIFFSNAASFNDPFECFVEISCDATAEEVIAHLQRNDNTKMANAYLLALWKTDKGEFIKEFSKRIPAQTRKNFLIFCLSKQYDNILMWSHYADGHKGICIGYQTTNFDNHKTIKCDIQHLHTQVHPHAYLPLIKVQYAAKKPREFNMIKEEVNALFKFVYTKAKPWKYENEYRIILSQAALKNNPIRIDQGEIKEILFGEQTDIDIQKNIITTITSRRNDVKFYRMNMVKGKYALKRELISI